VTRERRWRALVVEQPAPQAADVIVDVGCGTGSLALLIRRTEPAAHVVGVDPDADVLDIARRKAAQAGVTLELQLGMGDALEEVVGAEAATAVVSSLVLHQCPMEMKRAILSSMVALLRPGGRLVMADYGRQRTRLMRTAFRIVQCVDGFEHTQPNADGVLPGLMAEAGFVDVREVEVVPTMTGSISVYVAVRP
jgi:ubiquinone/menaquinone biosynthesis C-methylase UbiE